MCSRLQKHIDWWVWITEQTVHISQSPQPPTSSVSLCLSEVFTACFVAWRTWSRKGRFVLLFFMNSCCCSTRLCYFIWKFCEMSHIQHLSLCLPADSKTPQINNKSLIKVSKNLQRINGDYLKLVKNITTMDFRPCCFLFLLSILTVLWGWSRFATLALFLFSLSSLVVIVPWNATKQQQSLETER